MQIKIKGGNLSLSGTDILKDINFEINDYSHIGLIGRNGSGKTSLLKIISGEYEPTYSNDESHIFEITGKPNIGVLSQICFHNPNNSLVDEIKEAYRPLLDLKKEIDDLEVIISESYDEAALSRYSSLIDQFTLLGGYYFESEILSALKKFGFSEDEKRRSIKDFSGGQLTKISLLKLVLSKPDILLLDEPTNHLDLIATQWLEDYLKKYKKAFVIVSHDRMFLDNVTNTIYEIEYKKTKKYVGNYSDFVRIKKEEHILQQKKHDEQSKEIERINQLVDRFRYKATKARMVQSRIKYLNHMDIIESPEEYDDSTFHVSFDEIDLGVKDILDVGNLIIGYDSPINTINFKMKRCDRVAIIGGNGLGKSTLIKTLMNQISPLGGRFTFGAKVKIGYFDQQVAMYSSSKTILEDFMDEFPLLNNYECRSALGAFRFTQEDVNKTIDMLSGGERVRLAFAKIFKHKPNFLILDEPTNHLDIVGKESLEDILLDFPGTILFVSHDRYFVKRIAQSILVLEDGVSHLYPYGYEHYVESTKEHVDKTENDNPPLNAKTQKSNFSPLKQKTKILKRIEKLEIQINSLEKNIKDLRKCFDDSEINSDYIRLNKVQEDINDKESELTKLMEEWEDLNKLLEQFL